MSDKLCWKSEGPVFPVWDTMFIDSFDHNTDEPSGLRGERLDQHVLSTSTRVSIFWVTETQARARRITKWERSGTLELDNKSHEYPWLGVVSFSPSE